MDPFKASLEFLPSHLMIKVSSDAHSARTRPTGLTSAQGLYFFFTVEDKQTQHDPKVNFQLKPKVRIKASVSMQPRWLTLTWQERGGWFLPMMLTHQRSDRGNIFPGLLASLSCPRLHLLLLRQPCSKKTTDAMQDAMFLGLKYQSDPRQDFQWDLMKCSAWTQQRAGFNITPVFDIITLASSTSVSPNCVLLSFARLGVVVPFISSEFFSIYVIIWDFRIHSKAKASRSCHDTQMLISYGSCRVYADVGASPNKTHAATLLTAEPCWRMWVFSPFVFWQRSRGTQASVLVRQWELTHPDTLRCFAFPINTLLCRERTYMSVTYEERERHANAHVKPLEKKSQGGGRGHMKDNENMKINWLCWTWIPRSNWMSIISLS